MECEHCIGGKHTDTVRRFPRQEPATKLFQRVHIDLVVFAQENESYDGRRYHLHAACEVTVVNRQWNLRKKEDIHVALRRLVAYVDRQYKCTIEIIQSDNESSLDTKFTEWCKDLGIRFEPSPTYSPSSNGRFERSGGVITTMARVIRLQSGLPANLWSEMYLAAGFILNRTPRARLNWKTPLEVLYRMIGRPNPPIEITHLRAYGCRCYPLIHKEEMTHKLNPKAHLGYLVGYEASNIWRKSSRKMSPTNGWVMTTGQVFWCHVNEIIGCRLWWRGSTLLPTPATTFNFLLPPSFSCNLLQVSHLLYLSHICILLQLHQNTLRLLFPI